MLSLGYLKGLCATPGDARQNLQLDPSWQWLSSDRRGGGRLGAALTVERNPRGVKHLAPLVWQSQNDKQHLYGWVPAALPAQALKAFVSLAFGLFICPSPTPPLPWLMLSFCARCFFCLSLLFSWGLMKEYVAFGSLVSKSACLGRLPEFLSYPGGPSVVVA